MMIKKTIAPFFILTFISLFISCINYGTGPIPVWFNAHISITVTIKDSISLQPAGNQIFEYRFFKYNQNTKDNSDIIEGNIYTNENGTIILPTYECTIAPSDVIIFKAYTQEMAPTEVEIYHVDYTQAQEAANEDDFAVINLNYLIFK